MKITHIIAATAIVFSFLASNRPAVAQADESYAHGSVWTMTYIRVMPGQYKKYMGLLNGPFHRIYDEAAKEKVILSYKIIESMPRDEKDWNVMVMVEFPNWASFDTNEERFEEIAKKVMSEGKSYDDMDMTKLRVIIGHKMGRAIRTK